MEVEHLLQEKPAHEMLEGEHRLEGIFVAYGDRVRAGLSANVCSIEDIAPTVLHLLGISIPDDFDGQPLKGLFKGSGAVPLIKAAVSTMGERLRQRIKSLKVSGKLK